MAGAWRRVRAAAQNREEEERRRLTGGPGGKILFISFFSWAVTGAASEVDIWSLEPEATAKGASGGGAGG